MCFLLVNFIIYCGSIQTVCQADFNCLNDFSVRFLSVTVSDPAVTMIGPLTEAGLAINCEKVVHAAHVLVNKNMR